MNPALKSFEHYPYAHRLPMKMGPYTLVELLGQGGMGAVYRGYREGGDGRRFEVAIKVVRDSVLLGSDAILIRSFSREVEVARGLAHSNVLQVQDFGEHHGIPYVVTDLLRGESTDALIASGRLSPAQSIRLLQGLVRGLAYMHAQEPPLVHRDVKPSNVFVTEQGDVKVVDYGLSKAVSDSSQSGSATHGTTPYMSPERYMGRVTPAADVFAVGAVIYELMTGKRLLDGFEIDPDSGRASEPSPLIVMRQAEHVEQHLLRREACDAVDSVVAGLGTVMLKCLRKEPSARYKDCGQLEDALDPFDRRLGASLRGVARSQADRSVARPKSDETVAPKPSATEPPRVGEPIRAPLGDVPMVEAQRPRSRNAWYVVGGTGLVLAAVGALIAASADVPEPEAGNAPVSQANAAPTEPPLAALSILPEVVVATEDVVEASAPEEAKDVVEASAPEEAKDVVEASAPEEAKDVVEASAPADVKLRVDATTEARLAGPAITGNSTTDSDPRDAVGVDAISSTSGELDEKTVQQYIRRYQPGIEWCYQDRLQSNRKLGGKATLAFTILPNGSTHEPRVTNSSLGDASLESCISKKMARWRFPPPKDGGVVEVAYPIILMTK